MTPRREHPSLVHIHDLAAKLDHAKREIVAARFCEIRPEAIETARNKMAE